MDTDTDIDELEPRSNGRPPTLPPDASPDELVAAVNVLTRAVDTISVELQGIREAVREHGTRIETFCQRVERAMGAFRNSDTIPPPPGDKS